MDQKVVHPETPSSTATLDESALRWLNTLDEHLRPKALAQQYPRIVNQIAKLWSDPERMRPYFDELTVDDRGGRAGFPENVVVEIGSLRHFYDAHLFPIKTDVWYKILTQIYD